MFNLNDSMRYWLYPYPCDMRKGFYTLSGLVSEHMGKDVRSGNVFIFLNRDCTSLKALHMETGGLCIYYLKLEGGKFHASLDGGKRPGTSIFMAKPDADGTGDRTGEV